jgi:hypothetical protein
MLWWRKFSRFDRGLVSFAAAILFLSSLLLVDDRWLSQWLSSGTVDQEAIGRIKTAVNDVRRRHGSAFSWLPLRQGSEIYQGDSIFTGDQSEALIITERGEQISISQKSLVVINTKTDSIRLDIDYGSVLGQVGRDQKLVISSGGDVTEFQGENALVKVDVGRDRNLVVDVLEGQVEITSDEGTRTLGPQDKATISEQGAVVDVSEIRIDLLSPVTDRILKPSEIQDLILSWKSSYDFTDYIVDISTM